jgi:hypothetical protein
MLFRWPLCLFRRCGQVAKELYPTGLELIVGGHYGQSIRQNQVLYDPAAVAQVISRSADVVTHQAAHEFAIRAATGAHGVLDVRANPVGYRPNVLRRRSIAGPYGFHCGRNGTAAGMAQYHYKSSSKLRRGKLNGAHHGRRDDIPSDSDHEEIAEALVE